MSIYRTTGPLVFEFLLYNYQYLQKEDRLQYFLSPTEEKLMMRHFEFILREFCKKFSPIMPKYVQVIIELEHYKNKNTCALSKDSYQPGHLPSVIRVLAVCFIGS